MKNLINQGLTTKSGRAGPRTCDQLSHTAPKTGRLLPDLGFLAFHACARIEKVDFVWHEGTDIRKAIPSFDQSINGQFGPLSVSLGEGLLTEL